MNTKRSAADKLNYRAKKRPSQESSNGESDSSSDEADFCRRYDESDLPSKVKTEDTSDCSIFKEDIRSECGTELTKFQTAPHNTFLQEPSFSSHDLGERITTKSPSTIAEKPDIFTPPYISSSQHGATSLWTTDRSTMKIIEFTKSQALLVPTPSDPLDAFRLFLDDDILDVIVRETNLYATKLSEGSNIPRKSRINSWKNLTREELLTFLGLLLHTGTIRLNRFNDYWKKHWLFNIACFGRYMSRNRFMLILRCLNFSSEPNDDDRLGKISPIINDFNGKMRKIYYPSRELYLDESMLSWRGRPAFRHYIQNTRHKFGVKLHVLAEPEGIILKVQVHTGADDLSAEDNVLKLLDEKLDSGHSVYMSSYYNSYGLAAMLLNRNTYCTGTLSKSKIGNPVELDRITLQKSENISLFLNGVHVGKWRDKRNVLYLSTEYNDSMIEVTTKKGQVIVRPSAIVQYNNLISDMEDLQDQMLSNYPCEKSNLRWYKKVFIHTLQMSLINACHIFNKFCVKKKMSLYDFRLNVLEKLLAKRNPETNPRKMLHSVHTLSKIENVKLRVKKEGNRTRTIREIVRKECRGCRAKKKRVATLYECKNCEGSPGYCTQCFCESHSL